MVKRHSKARALTRKAAKAGFFPPQKSGFPPTVG